jgi:hypothetical protein
MASYISVGATQFDVFYRDFLSKQKLHIDVEGNKNSNYRIYQRGAFGRTPTKGSLFAPGGPAANNFADQAAMDKWETTQLYNVVAQFASGVKRDMANIRQLTSRKGWTEDRNLVMNVISDILNYQGRIMFIEEVVITPGKMHPDAVGMYNEAFDEYERTLRSAAVTTAVEQAKKLDVIFQPKGNAPVSNVPVITTPVYSAGGNIPVVDTAVKKVDTTTMIAIGVAALAAFLAFKS